MRIGFGLPNIGRLGSADNVSKVAERAEWLAYDSLWTIERLLWPVKPQAPYPVTADGSLPEGYKYSLGSARYADLRGRAHEEDCTRSECSGYSLLQPGHAGPTA